MPVRGRVRHRAVAVFQRAQVARRRKPVTERVLRPNCAGTTFGMYLRACMNVSTCHFHANTLFCLSAPPQKTSHVSGPISVAETRPQKVKADCRPSFFLAGILRTMWASFLGTHGGRNFERVKFTAKRSHCMAWKSGRSNLDTNSVSQRPGRQHCHTCCPNKKGYDTYRDIFSCGCSIAFGLGDVVFFSQMMVCRSVNTHACVRVRECAHTCACAWLYACQCVLLHVRAGVDVCMHRFFCARHCAFVLPNELACVHECIHGSFCASSHHVEHYFLSVALLKRCCRFIVPTWCWVGWRLTLSSWIDGVRAVYVLFLVYLGLHIFILVVPVLVLMDGVWQRCWCARALVRADGYSGACFLQARVPARRHVPTVCVHVCTCVCMRTRSHVCMHACEVRCGQFV